MVLVSGGSRANGWQRDHDESLRFVDRLRVILAKYPTP